MRGSYRPNHNFGDAENRQMDIGYIDFPEGQSLLPGQSREINVTFFFRPELEEVLSPGRRWRIQEGAHLVGYGTVLDVIT